VAPESEQAKRTDKWMEDSTVLKRWGQPAEMSTILKFLASDDASYVTGISLVADGGMAIFTPTIDFI